jgi:hypothetical protein
MRRRPLLLIQPGNSQTGGAAIGDNTPKEHRFSEPCPGPRSSGHDGGVDGRRNCLCCWHGRRRGRPLVLKPCAAILLSPELFICRGDRRRRAPAEAVIDMGPVVGDLTGRPTRR